MKKLLLSFLIVWAACKAELPDPIPAPCSSYEFAQQDTIKIILTADSHGQNSWPLAGGYDSIWYEKMVVRLRGTYDVVESNNMTLAGGRAIYSAMPMWYHSTWGNAEAQYSIDTVLKQKPDLVIISMSGNHTVNHMPADSAIYCFKYLIDTLNSLNVPFIISGQTPRQKTFTGGMTLASYYDSSFKINAFLSSYAPHNYVNNYSIEDTVFHLRPWPYMLSSDSLHFSDAGNDQYFANHMNTYIMDSIMANFDCRAINFRLYKSGGNVILSARIRAREVYVSGSYDKISFNLLHTYTYPQSAVTTIAQSFTDAGYTWYKVEVVSGRRRYTVTVKIN